MVSTRQSSSSSGKPPKLPKAKELSPRQEEELLVKHEMPKPLQEQEIDTLSVRINDYEGIIEKIVIVDADYQVRINDKYVIVGVGSTTATLPAVASGKMIVIKNTGGTDVTVDGGDFDIDGAATVAIPTTETKRFVFIRAGGITDGDWVTI